MENGSWRPATVDARESSRKPLAMTPEEPAEVEDRGMTLAAIPLRCAPPIRPAPCFIKFKLHKSQEALGDHLHLECSQDRLFGPCSTFFHAEPLFVIAEAVFLAKPGGLDCHDLCGRQGKRRARQADLPESTCCHTFRATGITAYLSSDGRLSPSDSGWIFLA